MALAAMPMRGNRCRSPTSGTSWPCLCSTQASHTQLKIAAIEAGRQPPKLEVGNLAAERDFLHVRDVSHGDTEAQSADVNAILGDLGIAPGDERIIEVWNKADRLEPDERERLLGLAAHRGGLSHPVLTSAITGEGLDRLKGGIEERLAVERPVYHLVLEPEDGSGLNWLYEEAEVLDRRADEDGHLQLAVRLAPEKEPRLLRRWPSARRMR